MTLRRSISRFSLAACLVLVAVPALAHDQTPIRGYVMGVGFAEISEVRAPVFGGGVGVSVAPRQQITADFGRMNDLFPSFTVLREAEFKTAFENRTRPLVMPWAATAQTAPHTGSGDCRVASIYELSHCVEIGEKVRVTPLRANAKPVEGAFRGFSDGSLVLEVGRSQFQLFRHEAVGKVEVFRAAGRLRRALTGAALWGSFLAISGPWDGPEPGRRALVALGAGSVVGVLLGLADISPGLTSRTVVVMTRDDVSTTVPVPPVTPSAAFAADVAHLAGLVQPGDRLRVRQFDGPVVEGGFVGTTDGDLVVFSGNTARRIPGPSIASVTRRTLQRPSLLKGALVGALIGTALSGLIVLDERGKPDAQADRLTVAEHISGVGFSAVLGAVVTRFMGRKDELLMVQPSSGTGGLVPASSRGFRVAWRPPLVLPIVLQRGQRSFLITALASASTSGLIASAVRPVGTPTCSVK